MQGSRQTEQRIARAGAVISPSPPRQRIIEYLTAHGPATPSQVADALGLSRTGTRGSLKALAARGKVIRADIVGPHKASEWVAHDAHTELRELDPADDYPEAA